jgi:hypothetical protein
VTQRAFDVWLHGFPRNTREAPSIAISRVFAIPVQAAEALVATLPRVVKRDASESQAERLVHALEAIGGVAEAVPTRVVPAPVLVVGTQPVQPRAETLVRHASRSAQREHAVLGHASGSGETIKLGTQEVAAFHLSALLANQVLEAAPPQAAEPLLQPMAQSSPDATLVDPVPPRWPELEGTRATVAEAPPPEPRGRWDDLELAPPGPSEAPISLAPPPGSPLESTNTAGSLEITRDAHSWLQKVGQGPIELTPLSSHPPPASDSSWLTLTPHPAGISEPPGWKNPMALPPRDAPLRSVGMRAAVERSRFARSRSQPPPSMRPVATQQQSSVGAALAAIGRGDLRAASNASPAFAFAIVLAGITLAFAVAYAAL